MKRYLALALAIIMALSLCACGSKDMAATEYTVPAAPAAASNSAKMYSMDYATEDSGMFWSESAAMAEPESAGGEAMGSDVPDENPQKIIYSASATVETTEFEQTLKALEALISSYDGWIEQSSISNANYYNISRGRSYDRSASYTIRIPSESFRTLMNGLSTLGNVPYTHTYSENVTSEYYDVKARLTAYETQEKRMLEMMEIAETVEDILTIEDKLADLRYRMDSLQSSLNNWDRRVSYSSLSLEICEVEEYTPEKETKISYGAELVLTLKNALKNTGSFFKELLLVIVSLLPAIVILSVLIFVCRPLLKKLMEKARLKRQARVEARLKKKEAKQAEREAKQSEKEAKKNAES